MAEITRSNYKTVQPGKNPENLKFGIRNKEGTAVTLKRLPNVQSVSEQINAESLEIIGDGVVAMILNSGATDATVENTVVAFDDQIKEDLFGYTRNEDTGVLEVSDLTQPQEVSVSWVERDYSNVLTFKGFAAVKYEFPRNEISKTSKSLSENPVTITGVARNVVRPDGTKLIFIEKTGVKQEEVATLEAYIHGFDLNLVEGTEPVIPGV